MKENLNYYLSNLKQDIPAGLVVFLVALPLCLGISLASGAPMLSGVITGIVGGVVVALLSGSQLSVSGPAAGLTVIVLAAIQDLGFPAFLVAVVIAGIFQLILGFLKAGIIGLYFPSSVIKGMLAAIGIILIMKQIPHFLGVDTDAFGEMEFFQPDNHNTFSAIYDAAQHIHPGAFLIGAISLIILIVWDRPFLKRYTFFKLVPGALIVVVSSVLINMMLASVGPEWLVSASHLVQIPEIRSLDDYTKYVALPDFSAFPSTGIFITAGTLAIVASLETLLSVEAVDKLDPHKRVSDTNRELKAQGVGNLISGLIGGLPMTAVIVRSSANVNSGGQTRMSAFFHGVFLLLSVLFLTQYLNLIPFSALAAILLVIGYKLAKPALFKTTYKLGFDQFLPFVITILAILFTDLLIGISIGLAVGVFFILKANYKSPYFFHKESYSGQDVIRLRLSEHVSFLNKASITLTLKHLPENSTVIIDGSNSSFIDYDVLEAIQDFISVAHEKNIKVETKNIPDYPELSVH